MKNINQIMQNDDHNFKIGLFLTLFLFLTMLITIPFLTILFIFLLIFIITLYNITDKEHYQTLINEDIIPEWYLVYKRKKVLDNFKKYQIKTPVVKVSSLNNCQIKTYHNRSGKLNVISNPFDNCQNVSISNFQSLLNSYSKKNEINKILEDIKLYYNKNIIVVDINSYKDCDFEIFKKEFNLKNVKKMPYVSTNGSDMILIKFEFYI